jgi:glycosyltransferase involved in cell wall biosynthesis
MARTPEQRTAAWIWGGQRFAKLCASKISHTTRGVYAFTSAAKELLKEARNRGLATWLDHATAPRSYEMGLVQEEARRFPNWATHEVFDPLTDEYEARQCEELALADVVICGSTFAKLAVESLGINTGCIKVVPLGLETVRIDVSPGASFCGESPGRLNVLFVGSDGLRKGVRYLGEALAILSSSNIHARAAGDLDLTQLAKLELARTLDLLGPVPRGRMPELFRWADVLVLPSISDTFGMVILEAMAYGLAVISTPHTGAPDIMTDGEEGYIVPIRDSAAIAACLDRLAGDPELLLNMKRKALIRASLFNLRQYSARLIEAVSCKPVR